MKVIFQQPLLTTAVSPGSKGFWLVHRYNDPGNEVGVPSHEKANARREAETGKILAAAQIPVQIR